MGAKTPGFEKAITESRKLKAKPTQDELLEVSIPPKPLLASFTSAQPNNHRENTSQSLIIHLLWNS